MPGGWRRPGAWLAGLAFAFSPFHLAHAAYHPQVAQVEWIPLYLVALWALFDRPTATRAAGYVLTALAAALSSFYSGLILAVLTPVALIGQALSGHAEGGRPGRRLAGAFAALALVALAGYGYVRRYAPSVIERPASLAFPASDVELYTARLSSYLLPPVWHPLVGGEVRAWLAERGVHQELLERQLSVGWGLLALAAVAAVLWLGGRREGGLRAFPYVAVLGAAALICSLSPTWQVAGLAVPRPSGWLYRMAPMFRAHARFGMIVGLAVAIAAAAGFGALIASRRRTSRAVALVVAALAAVEFAPFPPWHWRDVLPTSAHRFLVATHAGGPTLDCVSGTDPAQISALPLFGPGLRLLAPGQDCGEVELPGKLAARGVHHLIVRLDTPVGDWYQRRPTPPGLRPVGDFRDALLYDVEAAPVALEADFGTGFAAREYTGARSYRWMGERAELVLVNRTGTTIPIRLRMAVNGFPGVRRVALVALRDGETRDIEAGVRPGFVAAGPFELLPGENPIEVSTPKPAVVADRVLGNGDPRPLAVAVGDVTIERLDGAGGG